MKNKVIQYFQRITGLTPDESKTLSESMVLIDLKKGSYLIKEGQIKNDSFLVIQGLVRQYKSIDGNEITTAFFTEEQWIISFENLDGKTASKYNLICVEDTILLKGNEQKAQILFKKIPRFERVSRQIMETVFREQQDQMMSHITSKPEKRYLELLASRPDILQRVPQYDIATYIGVKPESLSRIRKKIIDS